jgi:hypothetical protein
MGCADSTERPGLPCSTFEFILKLAAARFILIRSTDVAHDATFVAGIRQVRDDVLKQFPIIWKRSPHASSNSHILEH